MILPGIPELELFGVQCRGVPNEERVVVHVRNDIDLVNVAILIGLATIEATAIPLNLKPYLFDQEIMEAPAWLFIYTCPGVARVTTENVTGEKARVVYWGSDHTLFHNPKTVPMVVRFTQVLVGTQEPLQLRTERDLSGALDSLAPGQRTLGSLFGNSEM
jgi:hypothetical protein